jgi:hypothetical protein
VDARVIRKAEFAVAGIVAVGFGWLARNAAAPGRDGQPDDPAADPSPALHRKLPAADGSVTGVGVSPAVGARGGEAGWNQGPFEMTVLVFLR